MRRRFRPRPLRSRVGTWADPRVWLSAVIGLGLGGLVLLPLAADGAGAVLGARSVEGCRILRVIDGDTLTLACPGSGVERARLTGYDAPEVTAPACAAEARAGIAATRALRAMLWQADRVEVTRRGLDRYGRRLVALRLDGRALADRMIAAGHGRANDGGPRGGWCG